MTHQTLDTVALEARARALRSAYIRASFAALMARLRGQPQTADAAA